MIIICFPYLQLKHAEIPNRAKHRIILSNKHHISYLIIEHCHAINCHGCTELTLALVREMFWIISCKGLIKTVLLTIVYTADEFVLINPVKPFIADLPMQRLAVYE